MNPPIPIFKNFSVQNAFFAWAGPLYRDRNAMMQGSVDKAQFLRRLANRIGSERLEDNITPRFTIDRAWSKDFKIATALRIVGVVFACGAFAVWNGLKHRPVLRTLGSLGDLMIAGGAFYLGQFHAKRASSNAEVFREFSNFLQDRPVKVETFQELFHSDNVPARLLPPIVPSTLTQEEAFMTSSVNVSEIVPGLYLGNQGGAGIIAAHENPILRTTAANRLWAADVTRIICCIGDNHYKMDRVGYQCFDINDNSPNEDITKYFEQSYKIIEEAHSMRKGVFVHCNAGVSRSPTIVIAYMMRKYGMTFQQAFDFVKAKRPCVNPRELFIQQLKVYEKALVPLR